jgi:hypothetical protein
LNPEAVSESITYDPRTRSNPIPYSGKNILPTDLGYTSFFGLGNTIGASTLLKDVQEILSYRTLTGDTLLFALCRDGCYFRALAGDGTATLTNIAAAPPEPAKIKVDLEADELAGWTFLFNSPQGSTSPWHLWTQALLENELYLYQKGMKFIARISSTEKGQFFVERLIPAYIISASSKIYRYVAHLESYYPSAHATRFITYKGITLSVNTVSSLDVFLSHQSLTAKLLSAGIGAYLNNYLVSGPPAFEEIMLQKTPVTPSFPNDNEYSHTSVYFNNPTTWNFVLSIRGVALSIGATAGTLTLSQRIQDIYNRVKDGLVSAGISDVWVSNIAVASSDGSATTGAVSIGLLVGKIGGNYTVTKSSGHTEILVSTSYPHINKYDFTNYSYARGILLYISTNPISAGRVVSFTESLTGLNISYTAVAGDTRDIVFGKLQAQAILQGFDAFRYEGNDADPDYSRLVIMLPEAYYLTNSNPSFSA